MKTNTFFSKEQFNKVAWAAGAFAFTLTLINLFVIGGNEFVISLGDILPIILSIGTALMVYLMWHRFTPRSSSRKFWGWFVLGWSLWAVGEILYIVIGFITDEVPYPSAADFAYFLGTIFLIVALVLRIRETPRQLKSWQRTSFWLIFIALTAAVYFLVLQPIIAESDESGVWGTLLDAFYPLSDLALLLLGIRLLFDYSTRTASLAWMLVIMGFIFVTIADLVYSYAYSFDLYFPNGQVNLISSLGSSVPYTLAYLSWLLGLYRLQVKQETVEAEAEIVQPVLIENTHIVFFVNRDLTIDEVSANSSALQTGGLSAGGDFAKLLGLEPDEKQAILSDLQQHEEIADMPLKIRNGRNEILSVKMNGLRLLDPQYKFIGGILVLRLLAGNNNLDAKLSEYQQSIANEVKKKCNSIEEKSVCKFLGDYYFAIFKHLESLAYRQGGVQQGSVFIENLNKLTGQNRWGIRITAEGIAYAESTSPSSLLLSFEEILNVSRNQLERMTDAKTVDAQIALVRTKFTNEVKDCFEYIQRVFGEKRIK